MEYQEQYQGETMDFASSRLNGLATKPERAPEIHRSMQRQEDAITELQKAIGMLFDRLSPILRQEGENASNETLKAPNSTPPLVSAINDNSEKIWRANDALRSLLSRLEI